VRQLCTFGTNREHEPFFAKSSKSK